MKEQPELVAIMLCERIPQDAVTKDYSLIGLQSHVVVETVPVAMNLGICFSLTNGRGTHRFNAQLVGPRGSGPFPEQVAEVTFDGPLDVVEAFMTLRGVVIPVHGVYYLEVHCGDRFLGRRALHIQEPDEHE